MAFARAVSTVGNETEAFALPRGRKRMILIYSGLSLIAILLVSFILLQGGPNTTKSQLIGTSAVFGALLTGSVCTVLAARRDPKSRRGWTWLSVVLGLGSVAQLNWILSLLAGSAADSSDVSSVLTVVGYAVPMVVGILSFPSRPELSISRFRQMLDAVVITSGLFVISAATALGEVLAQTDTSTLVGKSNVANLVIDIVTCSLVLCIGMRQLPGHRMTWLALGSGVLIFAMCDTILIWMQVDGSVNPYGTVLSAGWMAGPLLVGLATFIPMTGQRTNGRDFTLLLHLIPYVPISGSLIALFMGSAPPSPLLTASTTLLFVSVLVRQFMIVYENVSLTRDLEAKVDRRTEELAALGSIMTSSTDAIVGISRDGMITAWNPAATGLYGYTAETVLGGSPDFLILMLGNTVDELIKHADAGHKLEAREFDWRRPDGQVVPIAITLSPIVGTEQVIVGISVYAQDITERRREADALKLAREEAMESARLKSEFLATMSHEIRTPMNAVIGLTELILETELDDTQRAYATGVHTAGGALLTVINDILDFSKLEAGKVVLEMSDFSLHQLVDEVGVMLAPPASAKGIELIAYCEPGVPEAARGDVNRVRQILLNLLSNAIKFTAVGEVVLRAAALPDNNGRVRIRFEVRDTGIGIAKADQARLFESFSQADASTTRRFGGTGLGLAISRRLVEVMGGTIDVQSEVGVGSTFTVELQLRAATGTQHFDGQPKPEALAGRRVLVVDDNETNRMLLVRKFKTWWAESTAVESAGDALSELQSAAASGHPYDLAALDARMPGVDGFELASQIRSHADIAGTPLIILTSGLHPDPDVLRSVGVTQWLPKPVRNQDLLDRVTRILLEPLKPASVVPTTPPLATLAAPRAAAPETVIQESGAAAGYEQPASSAETAASSTMMPVGPVVDLDRLADLAELTTPDGGDLMLTMIDSFVRRSPERLTALREAVANHECGETESLAHAIKGAAGTIGAHRVMQLAGFVEQQARAGELVDMDLTNLLTAELDQAIEELKSLSVQPA